MRLRICFVTSETTPYAKTGGLADVSGALLKYLHAGGHDIRLFMPAYAAIPRDAFGLEPVTGLQQLSVQIGYRRYEFSILTPRADGARNVVYLVECPEAFGRAALYTTDPDEHRRFLVLTHAAFICCQRLQFAPQIMHFNDWHAAAGTLLRRTQYAWDRLFQDARTVLTVHNIGYQGIIAASSLADLLPTGETHLLDQRAFAAGQINLLGTGLQYADLITTVSPTYAREIQTPEYGMGLDGVLRARSADVIGILNGVDYDDWDPRHDRHLPLQFGPDTLERKASAEAAVAAAAQARPRVQHRADRQRQPTGGAEGLRPAVRGVTATDAQPPVQPGHPRQRRGALRGVPAAHAAAVPVAGAFSRRLQR